MMNYFNSCMASSAALKRAVAISRSESLVARAMDFSARSTVSWIASSFSVLRSSRVFTMWWRDRPQIPMSRVHTKARVQRDRDLFSMAPYGLKVAGCVDSKTGGALE